MIGEYGIPPGLAFIIVLALGALYGALTSWIIDALRLPAFIITLASMFFLRGMSFILSRESVPIVHPWYDLLANYARRRQAHLVSAYHVAGSGGGGSAGASHTLWP